MIINELLLWIIGVPVFCGGVFIYMRKTRRLNFATALFCGLLAAFAVNVLVSIPIKRIVVIEDFDENTPGYFRHKEIKAYGHPDIMLHDGDIYSTKDLELSIGKNYLFNFSSSGMLLYSIVYSMSSGLPSSIKRADKKAEKYKDMPPIYIESGCYEKIPEIPDYWFRDVPPESLEIQSKNTVEIKWRIIPYELLE